MIIFGSGDRLWGSTLGFPYPRTTQKYVVVQSRNLRLTTIDHRFPPRLKSFSTSTSIDPSVAEFFQYTSGRWLWDEEKQLQDRFTPFNVAELQNVAAKSIGATKCVAMIKLAEGSFNKTFRLTMDDGSTVIARVPHPIAGPAYYTTASEVATMDFVRIFIHFLSFVAHRHKSVGLLVCPKYDVMMAG